MSLADMRARRLKARLRIRLANQIPDSFEISTFDSKPHAFLPADCIERLITPQAVREELKLNTLEEPCFDAEWQYSFVQWILEHAKNAFAIVIQIGCTAEEALETLMQFRETNFDDTCLPIADPRLATADLDKFFDPDIWYSYRKFNFYKKQWKSLVPIFSRNDYDYDLSAECIFPFFRGETTPKEGAFSHV
jgi:hypothetical protein